MMKNFEILNKQGNIVLIHHKCEPHFKAEINQQTKEISGLKVSSNGYLTKELNSLLEDAVHFIVKFFSK